LIGQRPAVAVDGGKVTVGGATVTATDIIASNGVIHVIDTVLLPRDDRMSSTGAAQELIRMAIDRCVPLYTHGQAAACTAVYEVAARGLVSSPGLGLSDDDRATLGTAMAHVRATDDASRQAWIMRHALDDFMQSLQQADHGGELTVNLR
jgi:hypothetical protein